MTNDFKLRTLIFYQSILLSFVNLYFIPANTSEAFQNIAEQGFICGYILVAGTAIAIQFTYRLKKDMDFIFNSEKLKAGSLTLNINLYSQN